MIVSMPDEYLTFDDLSSSNQIVCKAIGNPAPMIQWFRNCQIITDDDGDCQIQNTTCGYENTSILTVKPTASSIGKYTLKASNIHGEEKRNFSLFGELLIIRTSS